MEVSISTNLDLANFQSLRTLLFFFSFFLLPKTCSRRKGKYLWREARVLGWFGWVSSSLIKLPRSFLSSLSLSLCFWLPKGWRCRLFVNFWSSLSLLMSLINFDWWRKFKWHHVMSLLAFSFTFFSSLLYSFSI